MDAAIRHLRPPPLRTNFRAPSAYDAEVVKRRGFLEHGILAVAMGDPRLSWSDKMALQAIGEKLYGPGP